MSILYYRNDAYTIALCFFLLYICCQISKTEKRLFIKVKQPGSGEVLVKVKAAGLCGTDYELYTNDMVYIKEGLSKGCYNRHEYR
jgi:threonine dehydrogenase-like Zn-dependent dehydrogenase